MRNLTTILLLLLGLHFSVPAQRLKLESMEMGADLILHAPEKKSNAGFILEIRSREIFECSGTLIVTETKTGGSSVFIRIVGAQKPAECDGQLGPAKAMIPLDLQEGDFDLKVVYQTFPAYRGKLSINSTARSIVQEGESELFRMRNPRLLRIPEGLVWGKMEFRDEDMNAVAQKFLDEAQKLGCRITPLETGDYGEFYIRESGMQSLRKLSNGTFEWPFIFGYGGDPALLKGLAERLSEENANRIRFSISSTSGSILDEWVNR